MLGRWFGAADRGETLSVWRVLIVEDDPQMLAFFAASVQRSPELALVGSVGTVAQARAIPD